MTATYIGVSVPICNENFIVNPIWYRLFSQLFDISGVGSVSDAEGASVAPTSDVAGVAAIVSEQQRENSDISPVQTTIYNNYDDVSPAFALLQSEIADLRAQLDDLRKGLAA